MVASRFHYTVDIWALEGLTPLLVRALARILPDIQGEKQPSSHANTPRARKVPQWPVQMGITPLPSLGGIRAHPACLASVFRACSGEPERLERKLI